MKGITIEHFIIFHKIERVKELLVYNELTLSEIAWKMHYSSVQHLSNQFKKVTGLTPSYFKKMKHKRLKVLESIWVIHFPVPWWTVTGCVNNITFSKSFVTHGEDRLVPLRNYLESNLMSLLNIVILLIIIGVLLWLVNTYIPMDGKIKRILNIVVVIAVIIWLLKVFGIFSYVSDIQV